MSTVTAEPEVSPREKWLALGALVTSCLAVLLVLLDNTVVVVALPTLANELDAGFSALQWVVDSYTLPFAGLLLMFGHLGDRYGRRRVMIAGLVGIAVMSVVGAVAESVTQVLVARAGMGIAAAAVFPATLAIITTVFRKPRARALGIAAWTAMAGFAVAIGPTIGGWLLNHFTWHSIFWMNLPVAAVAVALTLVFIGESRSEKHGPIDAVGIALSIAAIFLLVWSFIEAPRHGWISAATFGGVAGALALLALFAWWELRAPYPVLDVRLFRIPRFAFPAMALAVSYFAMFGFLFIVSQYFQAVLLMDPLTFGIHSLPFAAAIGIGAPVATWFGYRYGHTVVVVVGMAVLAAGLYWAGQATIDTTYWEIPFGSMILMGGGLGIVTGPVTDSIMSSVPADEAGAGSAVNDTTREVGGALGIAVLGSVLFGRYHEIVSEKLDSYGPIVSTFLSDRERDLIVNSPVSVLEILGRPGLPASVNDLDDPNSLVYAMQDAAMQGWKISAMVMVVSVVVTAIVFAIFMPWSRGTSLVDAATEDSSAPDASPTSGASADEATPGSDEVPPGQSDDGAVVETPEDRVPR
ncbi:MFS transporter [Rhodococcus triatomae]|uniref:Drug resistance transporter, EmrB/QacA subfamily n=1 Tax=Rhodococcus triatomae TaxID=300028 RepID=A0A1G8LCQ4_9NOCA|nr:MFS transporter [Rhodococcus triatomae]QNG20560.1 MFS transporter [Rhodococcus triatomae]QNG23522.1 MFS transporter [Rhodococcus triatomae]SDI53396.1 drug resistance transporter, EmrB/QacA subfamily [Rhodococcus triatomae]